MQVSCQCGHVKFTTPTSEPLVIYHCHCLECRAQTASAFGTTAKFPVEGLLPLNSDLKEKLGVWSRKTDAGNTMDCYFCKNCGTRVMHIRRGQPKTLSIKGGAVQGLDWTKGIHIWVKRAVVPIPEGAKRWEGEPEE
jgi:hypothetical protein